MVPLTPDSVWNKLRLMKPIGRILFPDEQDFGATAIKLHMGIHNNQLPKIAGNPIRAKS